MEHFDFKIKSAFAPTGDQPEAIRKLTEGVLDGIRTQVLVGVTGSGKTFTMANVIKNVGRPTLVIAHNKTLAAQLCNEFREFFPENRVEYFVSYYDYYQPESYIPSTDTYIEKDLSMKSSSASAFPCAPDRQWSGTSCCANSWRSTIRATIPTSNDLRSACAGTSWKFFPRPIPKWRSAWSFSATRSRASAKRMSSREK